MPSSLWPARTVGSVPDGPCTPPLGTGSRILPDARASQVRRACLRTRPDPGNGRGTGGAAAIMPSTTISAPIRAAVVMSCACRARAVSTLVKSWIGPLSDPDVRYTDIRASGSVPHHDRVRRRHVGDARVEDLHERRQRDTTAIPRGLAFGRHVRSAGQRGVCPDCVGRVWAEKSLGLWGPDLDLSNVPCPWLCARSQQSHAHFVRAAGDVVVPNRGCAGRLIAVELQPAAAVVIL